jgi:uncharacterized protein
MNEFNEYRQIRNEVDAVCSQLHRTHEPHTQCRKGCSACCMNFGLTPVEFHAIAKALNGKQVECNPQAEPEDCIFLIDHICSIYDERPLICRSHGLPIVQLNDDTDELELSFCPLNFTQVDDEYFTMDNSYDQDRFNSKLARNNFAFGQNQKLDVETMQTLIPMNLLKDFIGKPGATKNPIP